MHLPALLRDLAIVLGLAGVANVAFRRLGQPVVLGYILAGVLAGPRVPWMPSVYQAQEIQSLAELGVVFLLFSLGLEFSFGKLLKSGLSAFAIASAEVAAMGAIGFGLGQAFGWPTTDSIFLGAALSISSTTIIVKAFEELKASERGFAQTTFGVLVMEDLAAILILIALPSIALARAFSGGELLLSLGRLGLILPLWAFAGALLAPRALRKVRRWIDDETLLLVSVGFCLVLVLLSEALGYSAALGAFVAGAILAESADGHRIERILTPVRDLFGAIFFVSIGMLFDPRFALEHPGMIAAAVAATVVGKTLSTGLGALASGASVRAAAQTGFSLAQIGEFSFIIAALGRELKVTGELLHQLAVAVAVATTFTTPYMIRWSDPFARWLERALPPKARQTIDDYHQLLRRLGASVRGGALSFSALKEALGVAKAGASLDRSRFGKLAPWGAHLARALVKPGSRFAGATLAELEVRRVTGASVLVVERGARSFVSPPPTFRLLPLDVLTVLGDDEQLSAFAELAREESDDEGAIAGSFDLVPISVPLRSPLAGRTLDSAKLGDKAQAVVVAIERGDARTVNPDPTFEIQAGDFLWLVAPRARIPDCVLAAAPAHGA